jgi:hypothetical protein
MRAGKLVWEGDALDSLKRFKDDVNKVAKGVEFGVGVPFGGLKIGDKLTSYNTEQKREKMIIRVE